MKKTLAVIAISAMAVMGCDAKKANAMDNVMDNGVEKAEIMKGDMQKKHHKMSKNMEHVKGDHKKIMDDHKKINNEHDKMMDDHKKIMDDHKQMKEDIKNMKK